MELEDHLLELRDALDERYSEVVKQIESDLLIPMDKLRSSFTAGKKLRPLLLLMTTEACGGKIEDAMDYAVAIELVQGASLVHDDTIDGDAIRRGQDALHVLLGTPLAVFTGDAAFATAIKLLAASPKYIDKVMKISSNVLYSLCRGVGMEFAMKQVFNEDPLMEVVRLKTAVFFAGAAHLGAVAAHAPPSLEETAFAYGSDLGTAFQVVDDGVDCLLTIKRREPVGDIKDRRMTYPLLALYGSNGTSKDVLARYVAKKATFDELLVCLEHGRQVILDATLKKAAEYTVSATKRAQAFPSFTHRAYLEELPAYVTEAMLKEASH